MTPPGTSIGWQLSATGATELTDTMVLPAGAVLPAVPPVRDAAERPSVTEERDGDRPRVAPQVMFLLKEDVEGPGVTAAGVCAAASVAAGLAVTAADGVTVTGVRLAAHAVPCDFDLSLVGALLELGGDVVATAAGAAVAGHPAEAVARFVNQRAANGEGPLRRGQLVGSGLLMEPRPVTGPGEAAAVFGRLGTVSVTIA
jgi:2-oxo-3-hexenedioate decarboxylase